jgi:very-short-patch-repair endonuclease
MTSYQKYENLNDRQKLDILTKEYIDNKKSFADIAIAYNTYPNKVRRDAKKLGIAIRDKSEAQSNALKNGRHSHPTKGKKRSDETKSKIGLSVMNSWDSLSDKELKQRKNKSKLAWQSLDEDHKDNMIQSANKAVRESSKLGSKLEKYLLNELLSNGYLVEFHKEQILSNTKLQIDLFLPTIGVAIEVDGPSHFLPVWGEDVLNRNKKYDSKKTGLIIGKGLSLIRIKQTHDYSKTRAGMVYSKLVGAIEELKNTKGKTVEIED